MKKLVVMSGKGGVGKSTVAANLAFKLTDEGKKVGVFDSDFHGPTIPKLMGVKQEGMTADEEEKIRPAEVKPNLKVVSMEFLLPDKDTPVIWRGPMKMKVINQFLDDVEWGDIDYLIIDLPPGTGDEPLSIAQQIPDNDGAVIVTTPQEVSVRAVKKSVNFARKLDMDVIGVVENMSSFRCPHCGERIEMFGEGGGEDMADELGVPFLGRIPWNPDIVKSGETGSPFFADDSELIDAFGKIVGKIEKKIGG